MDVLFWFWGEIIHQINPSAKFTIEPVIQIDAAEVHPYESESRLSLLARVMADELVLEMVSALISFEVIRMRRSILH